MRKLLLISSSRTHGTGFLEHCSDAIAKHLSGVDKILFIPFALKDHAGYAGMARKSFDRLGIGLDSLHESDDLPATIRNAQAIFTGGGNTFRLLKTLQDAGAIQPIRDRIANGMPYMGSSAGTNLTCPTIRTTNDMPIVQPDSFEALGVIPFQINPHFIDPDPNSKHQGETRETRINEYHEENESPVLGIREGCWLEIEGDHGVVAGQRGARLFAAGSSPREIAVGESIDFLLK